jgi:CheY-like chemotaxis protein
MRPKVLIVDDDQAWLRLMQVELEDFSDSFSVLTAKDGNEALDILKKEHISFVVTDLRMPGMDGYDLLTQVLKGYPDIPVYIITAYDKPKTRDVVFKSGATGYLTKPFSAEELVDAISHSLKKRAEGGSLHNVSLETFLQLIEMEQKTCTLHISDKKRKKGGVLFFRNGDIMNARIGNRQGKEAAYEILSWSNVSLSIEHDCVFQDKKINGDLQAILLDAMRSKDEGDDEDIAESEDAPSSEILLEEPVGAGPPESGKWAKSKPIERIMPKEKAKTSDRNRLRVSREKPVSAPDFSAMSPIDAVRKKIEMQISNRNGVQDVYQDQSWSGLIHEASRIGESINLGNLNVFYINKGQDKQFIIVPGSEIAVVAISVDSPRDRILDIFG